MDLRDHLGWALNHLPTSNRTRETSLMTRSGFYTNRTRFGEMLALFREAVFAPEVLQRGEWGKVPTDRCHRAGRFRALAAEDPRVTSRLVMFRAP